MKYIDCLYSLCVFLISVPVVLPVYLVAFLLGVALEAAKRGYDNGRRTSI